MSPWCMKAKSESSEAWPPLVEEPRVLQGIRIGAYAKDGGHGVAGQRGGGGQAAEDGQAGGLSPVKFGGLMVWSVRPRAIATRIRHCAREEEGEEERRRGEQACFTRAHGVAVIAPFRLRGSAALVEIAVAAWRA